MILRSLIFFILSGTLVITASAQFPSVNNRFTFDKIKGCAPLTVIVDAPECGSTSCNIDFGDGSGGQPMIYTYTYTTPGIYSARIIFGASGSDLINVEVLPDIQPEFDIVRCAGAANTIFVRITDTTYDDYTITYSDGASVPAGPGGSDTHTFATSGAKSVSVKGRKTGYEDNCTARVKNITIAPSLIDGAFTQLSVLDGTSLQLGMTLEPFTQYRLEMATNNATTWQNAGDIYAITDLTIDNLSTDNNFYCFRIATFDPCSNTVTGYSDQICSVNFDVTADNRFNHLEWLTSSTGITGYSISKADPNTTFTPLASIPPAESLDDSDVDCTITYTYQLVATYSNGSTSTSLSKETTSRSTTPPTAVQNISASVVSPNQVDLVWTQDPEYTATSYEIFRSALGFTTKFADTPQNNTIDNDYSAAFVTCYQIRYRDVCGNESDVSLEACPMMLTGFVDRDNSAHLSWTPYNGWSGGVSGYSIEKYDASGQLVQTFTIGNVTSFVDDTQDPNNQVHNYIIVAVPNDGTVTPATSNTLTITKESYVFYPNAFTPNGDELNDIFYVSGQFIAEFEMKIYNRWGELMFTSNDPLIGWDGSSRGNVMPEGTYVFFAKITDLAGRTFERTGSILLLKKKS